MGKKVVGIVCDQCKNFLTEEVKPSIFICKNCELIYDLDSISPKSISRHLGVKFSSKDLTS